MADTHRIDKIPSREGVAGASRLIRMGPATLIMGLVGSVYWSCLLAVPSEPDESCVREFGIRQGRASADYQAFPPSMTCTFEDVPGRGTLTFDYISDGERVFLITGMAIVALLVIGGLALTGVKWFKPRVPIIEPQEMAVGVRWRRMPAHLVVVAVLGLGVTGLGPLVAVLAGMLGDYFGLVAMVALIVFCSIATATTLDRRLGPRRGDVAGSRRRGVTLGATGCYVSAVVTFYAWELDVLDIFDVPSLPTTLLASIVAIFWIAIAVLQWLLTSRSQTQPHTHVL